MCFRERYGANRDLHRGDGRRRQMSPRKQGCSEGFPEGEARGKSRGAALLPREASELPEGKSEYPRDHPWVNFSRQPLRTFRYLSDLSRDAVNWTSFRSCNEFVQHVRGPVHAEVW